MMPPNGQVLTPEAANEMQGPPVGVQGGIQSVQPVQHVQSVQSGIQPAGTPFQPGVAFAQPPRPQGNFNITQQQMQQRMQQQMLANAQRLAKSKASGTSSGDRRGPEKSRPKSKVKGRGKARNNGNEGRSKAGNSKKQARSSNRAAHTGSTASSRNSSNASIRSTSNTNPSSTSGNVSSNGAAAAAAAASLSSNLKALSSNLKNGSQKSHRPQNLHGLHRVGSMNVAGPMSAPASGISPRDTSRMMTDFSPVSGQFSQGDTGANNSGVSAISSQPGKGRSRKLSRSVPATPLTSGGSLNASNKQVVLLPYRRDRSL